MSSLKNLILSEIFKDKSVTRVELSQRLDVGASTISQVVGKMIDEGILAESEDLPEANQQERGRRRVPLRIAPDAFYALGLDLGREHIRGVLVGGDGRVVDQEHEQRSWEDAQEAIGGAQRITRALVQRIPARGRLIGACFADPGLVDHEKQTSLVAVNIPGWRDVNVPQLLKDELKCPILVFSSFVPKCVAEQLRGAAVGVKDFIFVDMGVGVAAGIVSDGRMIRGRRGLAGELGHTCVNPGGRLCSCGSIGCLEAECSGWAIVKGVEDLLRQSPATQSMLAKAHPVTAKMVVAAALNNDTLAQRVLAQAGRALGIGLANLVNLLNPELIVFGGGLSAAGEVLLGPAWQTMLERTLAPAKEHIRFEVSKLDENAGALGAALMAVQRHLLQDEF